MNLAKEKILIPFKGILPSTLIDWPGKIAAVLFVFGCNFRCHFCHNPELVLENNDENIDFWDLLDFLKKRRNWIDGIVITGGEPTLYKDLPLVFKILKNEGFLTKLDTNGTNPQMIEYLLEKKLVDYIAMDIKGSPEKYQMITGYNINFEIILKSIQLIMKSDIDYEFRTTVLPRFHKKEDFEKIGNLIKGAKKYYLQQFYPTKTLNKIFMEEFSYNRSALEEFQKIMSGFVKKAEIRGI